MRQMLEDEQIETIHVYMVRDDSQPEPEPHWPNIAITPMCAKIQQIIMASIAMFMLAGFMVAPAGGPMFTIKTMRIPLIALPAQVFMTSVAIIPTGVQVIPATSAKGTLTVYNGSTLQESLPAGFIVTSAGGIEVETDQTVTISAADPPAFGVASVPAHAVQPGAAGNIAAYSVKQNDGSSMTIKNLSAFTGGADGYTRTYATAQDIDNATTAARRSVEAQQVKGLLIQPCSETVSQNASSVTVERDCQGYTYTLPKRLSIISAKIQGKFVAIEYRLYNV